MKLSRPAPWQPPIYPDEAERRALAREREAAGDPRGRFMAVQLKLALRGPDATAETYDLVCEEQRLLALHEDEWLQAFGLLPFELRWFRGLPDEVSLSWPRFLQVGAELLRTVRPRSLKLTRDQEEKDVRALVACPELAALETLELLELTDEEIRALASSSRIGNLRGLRLQATGAGLRALASSPFLRCLKRLHVRATALFAGDAHALVAAPWFRHLDRLELVQLWDCTSGDIVAGALTSASHPPRLHTLELGYNKLEGPSIDALAAWPGLSSVEVLDLEGNELEDRDVATLLGSPYLGALQVLRLGPDRLAAGAIGALGTWPGLKKLTKLTLDGADTPSERAQLAALCVTPGFGAFSRLSLECHIHPDALARLASWPPLARFESLSLSGMKHFPSPLAENDGLAALARSSYLGGLRSLQLRAAVIDENGLASLLGSPSLQNVRHLAVVDCLVGDAGAQVIALWPGAAELETLQLTNAAVSNAGAKALATSPLFPQLRGLSLRGNAIGAPGAAALAAAQNLGRLEVLCLDQNDLRDRGARALASSPVWSRLRYLGLCSNRIGDAGGASLARGSERSGPHLSPEENRWGEATTRRLGGPGLPVSLGPKSSEDAYLVGLGFRDASL